MKPPNMHLKIDMPSKDYKGKQRIKCQEPLILPAPMGTLGTATVLSGPCHISTTGYQILWNHYLKNYSPPLFGGVPQNKGNAEIQAGDMYTVCRKGP